MQEILTPQTLLAAYASGYFPMAEGRHEQELFWFHPSKRGILPLNDFRIPRSLKRFMRHNPFETRVDAAFEQVMRHCAEVPRSHETGTWINDDMISLYTQLHAAGYTHSVESWRDGQLVGGLYGVSIGGVFCGESMFSLESEASKVALVRLVDILNEAGYLLLDTQFINPHLQQFGAMEITKRTYMRRLEKALNASPNPSNLFSTVSVSKGFATSSQSSDTNPSETLSVV